MATTTTAKAGKYELLVDHFEQANADKTSTVYGKGDIVTLSAEDAERLTTAGAVAEPGSLAQAEADRLQAEADAARAAADDAKARAAEAAKEAKAS